jgi:hypothetical protein
MNKILVGIPVIYDANCVRRCLAHIKDADGILIIDNNATTEIKEIIRPYNKIVNDKNIYVNPAWNQIMRYFLDHPEFDTVIILNSDIYLKHDVCTKIRLLDLDSQKVIPLLTGVKEFTDVQEATTLVVEDGVAGVFLCLSRKMVEAVYPIPEEIKLWFGDNWIFKKLRLLDYKMTIYSDLQAMMDWSRSIGKLPEATTLIEEDKKAWSLVSKRI